MSPIPENILQLLTVEGFINRYWEFLSVSPTFKDAYEAVERQYESTFGKRKYNDYLTFKSILSRHRNKKRSNEKPGH